MNENNDEDNASCYWYCPACKRVGSLSWWHQSNTCPACELPLHPYIYVAEATRE